MQPFDLLNAPLEGINLIEASAGTGKTYNIEGLYIRLVLEMQLQVDQILVLTFTKAATEELKDRIRTKLVRARDVFDGKASDDPLITSLANKHPDPAAARLWLHETLIDFDKAAIFTIHGFCQRVLHENAFETRNLFDTELITNQTALLQEVADDFWRKTFYQAALEFINFTVQKVKGPEYFYRLLNRVKTPGVKIVPDFGKPALDALPPFRASLKGLKKAWPGSREAVIQALRDPGLNATIYGSLKPAADHSKMTPRDLKIVALVEAMDHLADPQSIGFPLFENFEKFTASRLSQATKKKHAPPEHDFFNRCDEVFGQAENLKAEMDHMLGFLKAELFIFSASELPKRKKAKNIQYFDDLLITLLRALETGPGNLLGDAIRQRYKAALVDEFQDTDSIQYAILTRLFAHPDSLLFMIGDPKQAIYGFRGADIFSYMQASRKAAAKFTLTENWRSQPDLITAVNTLFSSVKAPFVFDEIPFEDGKPPGLAARPVEIPGAPLTLWYLDATRFSPDGKLLNKTVAVQRIAAAVGGEISRLLAGSSPVEPGAIAVLVRTNDQAQLIKDVLSARKIPSVLYSTGNIFDSREAWEVELILRAVADPASISSLKAALATDIMGVRAEELISDEFESHEWENRLTRFREYYQLWIRSGFFRMFRLLLAKEEVRQRLLRMPDGERRLTNVLHLADILHRQSAQKDSGMTGLLKWLAEQRDPSSPRLEEHQLQLESDEKAVKIVTIHKSKGLEYPVVFCPFGWEGSQVQGPEISFHDIDDDRRPTLDLGVESDNRHIALAQNEILSENLRLLYVALTRAKTRCYLVWGRIRTAETSALAYLLQGGSELSPASPKEDLIRQVKEKFTAKSDSEFIDDLKKLAARSQNSIRIEPLPLPPDPGDAVKLPDEPEPLLFCRKFSGNIDHAWKISSYSSLVSAGVPDVNLPDRDVPLPAPAIDWPLTPAADRTEPEQNADTIFTFPRGTRAGTFFHDILEHHDYASGNSDDLTQRVTAKLQQYGFDQKWCPTVCRALTDVFGISLRSDLPQLKLSGVPMTDRLNEMEFYFPLNLISAGRLAQVFKQHDRDPKMKGLPGQLEKLEFDPARGFMKGYIDMVFQHQGRFYLVDWKSNYLGADHESYDQNSLLQTMQANFYILQYHLYTLALHRYLQLRKPGYRYEDDFGGIFYVFIRGVDPIRGPEYGVFFDLPRVALVAALGKALIPEIKRISNLETT